MVCTCVLSTEYPFVSNHCAHSVLLRVSAGLKCFVMKGIKFNQFNTNLNPVVFYRRSLKVCEANLKTLDQGHRQEFTTGGSADKQGA